MAITTWYHRMKSGVFKVDSHPLIVTDFDWSEESGQRVLVATLNTDRQWAASAEHPLHFDDAAGAVTDRDIAWS